MKSIDSKVKVGGESHRLAAGGKRRVSSDHDTTTLYEPLSPQLQHQLQQQRQQQQQHQHHQQHHSNRQHAAAAAVQTQAAAEVTPTTVAVSSQSTSSGVLLGVLCVSFVAAS